MIYKIPIAADGWATTNGIVKDFNVRIKMDDKNIIQLDKASHVDKVMKIGEKTARAIEWLRRAGCKLGYDMTTLSDGRQFKRWWVVTPTGKKLLSEPDAEMHYYFRIMYVRLKRKWRLGSLAKTMLIVN